MEKLGGGGIRRRRTLGEECQGIDGVCAVFVARLRGGQAGVRRSTVRCLAICEALTTRAGSLRRARCTRGRTRHERGETKRVCTLEYTPQPETSHHEQQRSAAALLHTHHITSPRNRLGSM